SGTKKMRRRVSELGRFIKGGKGCRHSTLAATGIHYSRRGRGRQRVVRRETQLAKRLGIGYSGVNSLECLFRKARILMCNEINPICAKGWSPASARSGGIRICYYAYIRYKYLITRDLLRTRAREALAPDGWAICNRLAGLRLSTVFSTGCGY